MTTMKHVCFSGQLGCSGINPCRVCYDVKLQNVVKRCVEDARLTPEQSRIFYAAYDHYWQQLHQQMLADPQVAANALDLSRVRIEPAPAPALPPALSPAQDYGYGPSPFSGYGTPARVFGGYGTEPSPSPYAVSPQPHAAPPYAPPYAPAMPALGPQPYAPSPPVYSAPLQGPPPAQSAPRPDAGGYGGYAAPPPAAPPAGMQMPPEIQRLVDSMMSAQSQPARRVQQPEPHRQPEPPAPPPQAALPSSPLAGLDPSMLAALPPGVLAMMNDPEAVRSFLSSVDPAQLNALMAMVQNGGGFDAGPSDVDDVEGDDDYDDDEPEEIAPPVPQRRPQVRAVQPSPVQRRAAARPPVVVASAQGDMTVDEVASAGQPAPEAVAAPLNGTPGASSPKT